MARKTCLDQPNYAASITKLAVVMQDFPRGIFTMPEELQQFNTTMLAERGSMAKHTISVGGTSDGCERTDG